MRNLLGGEGLQTVSAPLRRIVLIARGGEKRKALEPGDRPGFFGYIHPVPTP
jgi:hypothetical protein